MGSFPERLRFLRQKKGITQKEIADSLGIANSSYSLYEKGAREPNFEMLEKIAKYFNVSIDYLLGTEIKYEATSNYEDIRNDYIDTLAAHFDAQEFTDEELDEIMNFVEFVKNKRKKDTLLPNAAHERTDIDVTEEMKKHDDDIMDDDNF